MRVDRLRQLDNEKDLDVEFGIHYKIQFKTYKHPFKITLLNENI